MIITKQFILINVLLIFVMTSGSLAQVPAFPGAEGFGSTTPGGRGGRVIEVTNLKDNGLGSFRNAIEASGPRIVVFRVGGTIELKDVLNITEPYITIAGQTAPGGGICIKNGSHEGTVLRLGTHDIIVRGLRIRPGPGGEPDGIYVPGSGRNIVIDHCSISWAVDENVTAATGAHDVSIQWCLISQGLLRATHHKGKHSMGLMFGSSSNDDTYNISAHHNLLTHNFRRNPLAQMGGTLDFVNNVIYNWGDYTWSGYVSWIDNNTKLNYVGNYVKPGPESNRSKSAVDVDNSRSTSQIAVYVEGNLSHHRTSYDLPEWYVVHPTDTNYIVENMFSAPTVTKLTADHAYKQVLNNAGAIIPERDTVDIYAVQSVMDSTAGIINNPSEFGGYPDYAPGTPPVDTDQDGMPDQWENENGLVLDNYDANDRDLDPNYDNVEVYINSLIPDPFVVKPAGVKDAINVKPENLKLFQNYPNPFNPSTNIAYSIDKSGLVELEIYNINGEKIKSLDNSFKSSGNYFVIWDGTNEIGQTVSSGVYLYRLTTSGEMTSRKMLFLK